MHDLSRGGQAELDHDDVKSDWSVQGFAKHPKRVLVNDKEQTMSRPVIWVTTKFAAFHYWKDAPDQVAFLRSSHRHLFHVKAFWEVNHNDRDLEFFIQKEKLEDYVRTNLEGKTFAASCEMLAEKILNALGCCYVDVSEDGENGAFVAAKQEVTQTNGNQCVTQVVKSKMFVGTEAEGPNRGARVLFVPGSVGISIDAVAAVMQQVNPDRVYLGAGNDRRVTAHMINAFSDFSKPLDVEVDARDVINPYDSDLMKTVLAMRDAKIVSLILWAPSSLLSLFISDVVRAAAKIFVNRPSTNVFIKRVCPQRKVITWVCLRTYNAYCTTFDDPLFSLDQDV